MTFDAEQATKTGTFANSKLSSCHQSKPGLAAIVEAKQLHTAANKRKDIKLVCGDNSNRDHANSNINKLTYNPERNPQIMIKTSQ